MIDPRLLNMAGVPARAPAAEKAAWLIRRYPLRGPGGAALRPPATVLESGWFDGPTECLHVLGEIFHGSPTPGTGFAGTWPLLRLGAHLIAPAMPVVAGVDEIRGPDAVYQLEGDVVWREATGERRPFLRATTTGEPPGRAFDLLWFGDGECCRVAQQRLHVEDLFSQLRVAATLDTVERLLGPRLPAGCRLLDGVVLADGPMRAELEVRRPFLLASGDAWRDPAELLSRRVDLGSVRRVGGRVHAVGRHEPLVFEISGSPDGWTAVLWEGQFAFRSITLKRRADILSLSVQLDPALDPLAPGVRGRLAFDLRANLVALG